ncbi:TPA: DUF4435 domain-containing protein [Vibrio cholerae]
MMQGSISPNRIANSIMQDSSFNGGHILVEGVSDVKLYKKMFNTSNAKIKVCFGRDNIEAIYEILLSRGYNKAIGIRDADFLRLDSLDYERSGIYLTDTHDSEGMIFKSDAFWNFIYEVINEEVLSQFISRNGCLRTFIYNLAYPLGCLRYANEKHSLGLSFKPEKPEGNKLRFKRFICERKSIYLGHDSLINTVVEYSKNRGSIISERPHINKVLTETISKSFPHEEIVNGHDLAEIIFIVCKKLLKSTHTELTSSTSVETMLRLTYSDKDFIKTELYKKLLAWQDEHGHCVLNY